ncbi:MAG: serine protease [Hyphomonas sp.]
MAKDNRAIGTKGDGSEGFDWKSILVRAPQPPTLIELLPHNGSPVVKRRIEANADVYLSISVLSFYHPEARKGITKQVPLIFADANWRRPTEDDLPQVAVMGPNPEAHPNMARHGNYAFGGRTFFGPARFDGSVDFNIGLHLFKSNAVGRKLVDVAKMSSSILTQAEIFVLKPVVDVALDALKGLLPDKKTPWVVGVIRSLATGGVQSFETGTWAAIAAGGADPGAVYLDRHDNLLRDGKGKPVQRPYIVYSVDATETNPDRLRIGGIPNAQKRLRKAHAMEEEVSDEMLERLFRRFCNEVDLSDELTKRDRDEIIADAKVKFARMMERRAAFSFADDDGLFPAKAASPAAVSAERAGLSEAEAASDVNTAIAGSLEALANPEGKVEDEGMAELVSQLQTAVADYAALVRSNPDDYRSQVKELIGKLRKRREFKAILELATRVHEGGVDIGWLNYFGAAADIELNGAPSLEELALAEKGGQVPAMVGEAFLAKAIELSGKDFENDPGLLSDCLGLQGRIWKQRAVRANPYDEATRVAFERAYSYYSQGIAATKLSADPDPEFHQVNLLALMHAADKWGIALGKKAEGTRWAQAILRSMKKGDRTKPWHFSNAGDAALYLGREPEAEAFYNDFIKASSDNPFAVNATRRQLVEMWGVDPRGNTGLSDIVRRMMHLSLRSNASVSLTLDEVEAFTSISEAELDRLEATFNGPPAVPAKVIRKVLQLSQSVGSVRRPNGDPVGTGFLLHGRHVHPDLVHEFVFITNDHVVCDARDYTLGSKANRLNVTSKEARICFEDFMPERTFQVKEVFWRSDVSVHDCAILRLFAPPKEVPAEFEIAKGLPPRWKTVSGRNDPSDERVAPRVFVIGHPAGRGLEITFEKNYMVDHELKDADAEPTPKPVRIHYRAPTEDGNSGSPVLSAKTQMLIGLHHARATSPLGGASMGQAGSYEANEGNWIQAILAAVKAEKPSSTPAASGGGAAEPAKAAAPAAPVAAPVVAEKAAPAPVVEEALAPLEAMDEGDIAFFENMEGLPEPGDPDYVEGGISHLEAAGKATSTFPRIKPTPKAAWPALADHPDTKHLAHLPINLNNGMSFQISGAVLRHALAFSATPVGVNWSRKVLFGIRGATPKQAPGLQQAPQFADGLMLTEVEPNHVDYLCTMGVWDRDTDQVWVCPGSTVPAIGYIWHSTHEPAPGEMGRGSNMLAPGVYTHTVGTHRDGYDGRQPGAFRQKSKMCVMRLASPELCFRSGNVSWDTETDLRKVKVCDNIHAGLVAKPSWVAKHYSAGCQVVQGTVGGAARNEMKGHWANFRVAAGLAPSPDVSLVPPGANQRSVKTSEDGRDYTYVLLPAREVRLAGEHRDAAADDLRFVKLRRGSQGDMVKALQANLGLTEDGDFGFLTQRALIAKQKELTGEADGVVTAANAAVFGLA